MVAVSRLPRRWICRPPLRSYTLPTVVEFITLFLGALIAEPMQVQLQVHADVAALEIRLDGRALDTLRGAPWELEVDFGEQLVPHLLEAIAYSGDGREIGNASQWVNLTPKETGVTLALTRDPSTRRAEARLSWQSLSQDNEPLRATATFDGEPLPVQDPKIVALPAHDPDLPHHLRVELEFPGELRSAAEIVFGGQYGDTVSSELTAFPVSLDKRRKLPATGDMQGWFHSAGQPLRVHAVEEGLAEIVVVQSPPEQRFRVSTQRRDGGRPTRPILAKDHRLRFFGVSPTQVARDQGSFVVFPRSAEIAVRNVSLRHLLHSTELPEGPPAGRRLADAVAVAGLFAHSSARRRAVVLITTGEWADASQFGPGQVRRYLESIGVPLVLWTPRAGEKEAGTWGAALNISNDSLLDSAYRELSRTLDRQRIVWLNGLYLPQTVAAGPEAEGVQAVR